MLAFLQNFGPWQLLIVLIVIGVPVAVMAVAVIIAVLLFANKNAKGTSCGCMGSSTAPDGNKGGKRISQN